MWDVLGRCSLWFFFFFQAEDGIRDIGVTGVQTCALPIFMGTTLLPGGLGPVLDLVAELLTSATYPDEQVEGERDRVVERVSIARSQPAVIARSALDTRRSGDHPYAVTLPPAELVAAVDGDALRSVHAGRVLPAGSTLVLVGELDPAAATDAVARAMAG